MTLVLSQSSSKAILSWHLGSVRQHISYPKRGVFVDGLKSRFFGNHSQSLKNAYHRKGNNFKNNSQTNSNSLRYLHHRHNSFNCSSSNGSDKKTVRHFSHLALRLFLDLQPTKNFIYKSCKLSSFGNQPKNKSGLLHHFDRNFNCNKNFNALVDNRNQLIVNTSRRKHFLHTSTQPSTHTSKLLQQSQNYHHLRPPLYWQRHRLHGHFQRTYLAAQGKRYLHTYSRRLLTLSSPLVISPQSSLAHLKSGSKFNSSSLIPVFFPGVANNIRLASGRSRGRASPSQLGPGVFLAGVSLLVAYYLWENGSEKGKREICRLLHEAEIARSSGRYEEAEGLLFTALATHSKYRSSNDMNSEGRLVIIRRLAHILDVEGKYEDSISFYKEIAQGLIEHGDRLDSVRFVELNLHICRVLAKSGQIGDAEKGLRWCVDTTHDRLARMEDVTLDDIIIGSMVAESMAYFQETYRGNLKLAFPYYIRSLNIAERTGDKQRQAHCCNRIGLCAAGLNMLSDAEEYLERAASLSSEIEDLNEICYRTNLATVQARAGKSGRAGLNFKWALENAKRVGDQEQIEQIELLCSELKPVSLQSNKHLPWSVNKVKEVLLSIGNTNAHA